MDLFYTFPAIALFLLHTNRLWRDSPFLPDFSFNAFKITFLDELAFSSLKLSPFLFVVHIYAHISSSFLRQVGVGT